MLSILLKEKNGIGAPYQEGEEPWETKVFKGDLVVLIPIEEIRQVKSVTPNYRLYHDPEVVLYADPIDVAPLLEREVEYLLPVYPASLRLKEYLKDEEMKMKMNLTVGDIVIFKLEARFKAAVSSVKGIIRYIGPHPDNEGILFGIEIDSQEQMYRGKGNSNGRPFFTCGNNNAVYVAMDKIVKKCDASTTSEQSPAPTITQQPSPFARRQTKSVKDRALDLMQKAGETIEVGKEGEEGAGAVSTHNSRFKVNDRVVLQSVKEEVIAGTVRWVGPVRLSKDMNVDPISVVGVETDKRIDPSKEFPGLSLDVTGTHGTKLFMITPNHSRVFLPEQLVLTIDEYTIQVQKNNAAQFEKESVNATPSEKRLATEFGMTVEEYRRQVQDYVDTAKQEMEHRQRPTDPKIEDENGEKLVTGGGMMRGGREGDKQLTETIQAAVQYTGPEAVSRERIEKERKALEEMKSQHHHDDYQVIKGGRESIVEDNYVQISPYASSSKENEYEPQSPNLPVMAEGMRVSYQSKPSLRDMRGKEEEASYFNDGSQDTPPNISLHSSYCPPSPPTLPVHPPPPPTDPHHQFTIGSMVCVDMQKGEPLYGVVQWAGTVPDFNGAIAGVELERPLRNGTDGTWHGFRFFTCPPGRAYFCPITVLRQDTRYLDQGQQKSTETDETAKLKEEISQLQVSIKNLQLEKENLQKATQEQIKREEQKWRDDKQRLLEENKQLRQQFEQEREQLEADKEKLMEENLQLKEENKGLMHELTSLREAHNELERETRKGEEIQAQLQSQAGLLSIENMRLKGQVKQLEESSATDIKYWEVSYKQVSTNRVTLGSGGWGKVKVGLLHGQKVAVKMLHSEIKSSYYNQLVRREISMLAKVRHPNLLLFIAGVLDHPSGSPIIITELLDTSLRKAYTDRLIANNRVRISIMRDVAAALNYIHHQKESIIHRDVSSANVLLEARGEGNWKGKLSDFGSANLVQFSTTVGPGAIPYAAPEVPHNQTTKMDVYSYGVLLCEVLLSEFPFKERFPDMLQSLSSSWPLMHQLILSCTKHSVTDRVDMKYVLDSFNEQISSDVNAKGFVPL